MKLNITDVNPAGDHRSDSYLMNTQPYSWFANGLLILIDGKLMFLEDGYNRVMKRFRTCILLWSAALLLLACGSGENHLGGKIEKRVRGLSDAMDMVLQVSQSPSRVEETMERMKELKLIVPASNDELKGWLPECIGGFRRKGFSIGNQAMVDISSITGSFIHEEENKSFELNVIDGAGEAGGVFTMVYIGQFNRVFEEKRADGFSKSMNQGDEKAVVSQDNRLRTAELEYLEGHRYYVKLMGENMDIDELWTIADGLKTSSLPGL